MKAHKYLLIVFILFPIVFYAQPAKDSDAYFNFLQQLYFENTDGRYNDFLLEEFQQHLQLYPVSQKKAQVLSMLANVEHKSGFTCEAFLDYLKVLFIYPKSESAQLAKKELNDIFESVSDIQLKMMQDSILSEVSQITPLSPEEGWFEMIAYTYSLQIDTLYIPLRKQIRDFRTCYGVTGKYDPILLFWSAQISRYQKNYNSALAIYQQLLALHPNSDLKQNTLLELGKTSHHCPGCAKQAVEFYLETINSFAGTEQAAAAQFFLARLYEDSLHTFDLALSNYQLYIENYDSHVYYKEALQRMGRLAGKLKKWPLAASAWQAYYEKCTPDSTTKEALLNLITIHLEHEKDYEQGAKTLLLYALQFNDPKKLYSAARIYAEKLKDQKRAKETLDRLLGLFPQSEYALKARELIKKLK